MKRFISLTVLVILSATALTGCNTVRAGARCRAGSEPGRDATHVLFCQGGRWKRVVTIGQAADILIGGQVSSIGPTLSTASGRAGATIGTAFTVTSRNGRVVPNAKVTLSAPSTGAGLGAGASTSGQTDASGVVSFVLPLGGTAGAFDLTATVDGTSVSTSVRVTVLSGLATKGSVTSGNNQSVQAGSALAPIVIVVTDASGNPVAGEHVGVLSGPSTVVAELITDASGAATFQGTASSYPGTYSLYPGIGPMYLTGIGTITYTSTSS